MHILIIFCYLCNHKEQQFSNFNIINRMKRIFEPFRKAGIIACAMSFCSLSLNAQSSEGEYGLLNHLGAGISLGTDGIGIDVAAPITDWAAVRAGISFLPKIKINKSISIDKDPTLEPNVDIEAKPNIVDFKLLADFYPIKTSSFHITAGFFVGNEDAVTATNTSAFIKNAADYGKVGIKLGDHRVTTDQMGNFDADIKVNKFKPYVGFGFGRAIPQNSRVSISCDFGVKFWGKPGLGIGTVKNDWDEMSYHKFTYDELEPNDNEDLKDLIEIAEKIVVYPVLNIRLSGRIF